MTNITQKEHYFNLTQEFTKVFACCEFALKNGGFRKRKPTWVEGDWVGFANTIDSDFSKEIDAEFKKACHYLLSNPPRKKSEKNGNLVWVNDPPKRKDRKAKQVILMVKRVRNNLLHGDKVSLNGGFDRDRDIKLIEASLIVLKKCFDFSLIQSNFANAYYA